MRKQAETLTAGLHDPEQKMRAIYDYVRTTMNWNGEYGIYVDVDLDKALQAQKAGGPEIALMLTSMLRSAGLDAHPVLISTRDNGKLTDIYSILTQFNHVLSYVKIGVNEYLLDATDPLCPHTLLPEHALNRTGWLVAKKNPFKISDTDSTHKALLSRAHFHSKDHVQVAGDNMYLNPIFFGRRDKDPFTLPERNFPVDFAYGRKLSYVLTLTLPEGFVVQETPKNVSLSLPKEGGQFRRLTQVDGNRLQFTSQFFIRKPHFESSEYHALREFYDRVVAAHAEQVVLKRVNTTAKNDLKE